MNTRLNAVADGAIHFYLYHYVTSRITRYTYGIKSSIRFDESNPEHQRRASSKQEQYDGIVVLPNAFDIILPKVRMALTQWIVVENYYQLVEHASERDEGIQEEISPQKLKSPRLV